MRIIVHTLRSAANALLLLGAALAVSSIAGAQATRVRVIRNFDSTFGIQPLAGDWNPADGDTSWTGWSVGTSSANYLILDELEFQGTTLKLNFTAGDDPWETMTLRFAPEVPLSLADTAELQLWIRPSYETSRPFVSMLLRLTMRDGSLWETAKVVVNQRWQRSALPVGPDDFSHVASGPQGALDLADIVGWELLFVDLPPGAHQVELLRVTAKDLFVDSQVPAESFTAAFDVSGSNSGEGSVLFRRGDWNPADGDTDWLQHHHIPTTYWSPVGAHLEAEYRSAGDPWETVSIRKQAASHFDLSGSEQVIAYLRADPSPDPNALVLSLIMRDGSVWQQGKARDVINDLGYSLVYHVGVPYRFALDPSGSGFSHASWSPPGEFDLNAVQSWELFFGDLGQGVHAVKMEQVTLRNSASFSAVEVTVQAEGTAQWQPHRFAADGVRATVSATGDEHDGVTLAGSDSAESGFMIEVGSDYENGAANAVTFRLLADDGETREVAFPLEAVGTTIMRVHTSCPQPHPGLPARPIDQVAWCAGHQGPLYGMDPSKFSRWELHLHRIPAGEHALRIAVFPQVE